VNFFNRMESNESATFPPPQKMILLRHYTRTEKKRNIFSQKKGNF